MGIGVCSHDKDRLEKAVFSNIDLARPAAAGTQPTLYSALQTIYADSTDRRIVYLAAGHIQAPNWTRDGKSLLFNSAGRIERLPVTGGKPEMIDTGFGIRCNNDHGISPDGTELVISDNRKKNSVHRFTCCRWRAAHLVGSPRILLPIGMAGRRTARR